MAEGVLFSVAQEVFKNLGTKALDEIALTWGFKDRLEQLKSTISTLKDVLLDAEEKQTESHAVQGWLERLIPVVYAADDLFDEVATISSKKKLKGGNPFIKEVRSFFSCSNQIAFAFEISQKIKTIRQQLDDIKKDGDQFNFFVHHSPEEGRVITRKKEQSYSYVNVHEIIGREGDKNAILKMILTNSSCEVEHKEVLPVISIMGIGGMGKTALAQLVYNDIQVKELFELRLWVCVSEVFGIKGIVEKILMSATNKETQKLEMQQLQVLLQKEIGGKKYFLVLDDVWNEDPEDWHKLQALLSIGKKGSKILVTTRLRGVAEMMSTFPVHELQGLLEEKTWDLFEKLAFKPGEVQQKPHLVEVGKEIIKKCVNVPLAIRIVASSLNGKEERKWLSFKQKSLAKISENVQSGIFDILKLSYHYLWSPLKNCFAYCALFPKDYEFDKEMLIDLWMAEGFIIADANESQSLEEIGQDYFRTLLERGFFQDVKVDEFGVTIKSCKMHDLIHDLAQEVSGIKCKVVDSHESQCDDKIHHLSFAYILNSQWKISAEVQKLKHLRTFLLPQQQSDGSIFSNLMCQQLISSFSYLRVLELKRLGVKSLPSSVGKLVHLRYLNLSENPITGLPDSITELHNLQTLELRGCYMIRRLPTNIKKLLKLRSLDVGGLSDLEQMPLGLGELTLLRKLPLFIINSEKSPELRNKNTNAANLSELKKLNNLRGELKIEFLKESKNAMSEATEAHLTQKQSLTELEIIFPTKSLSGKVSEHDEVVLEGLKPPPNLRKLIIFMYFGQKLPSWVDSLCITLPNLVEISLNALRVNQEVLPTFSKLPFLKCLKLTGLVNVEYMELEYDSVYDDFPSIKAPSMQTPQFFPSLEELELRGMTNLKGWWRAIGADTCVNNGNNEAKAASYSYSYEELGRQPPNPLSKSFPKLSHLVLYACPNLTSLPNCPNLKILSLTRTNKKLSVWKLVTTSSQLMKLKIDAEDLISLTVNGFYQLPSLVLQDFKLVKTDKLRQAFKSLSSSLKSLELNSCHNLRSISKGLEDLSALEKLSIVNCKKVDLSPHAQHPDEDEDEDEELQLSTFEQSDEEDKGDMPWKAFKNSLRYLMLDDIPKLVSLPSGVQHLTNLQTLAIIFCDELKELPEWISCLSSLQQLELIYCSELTTLPESFCNLTALNQLTIEGCPKLQQRCKRMNGSEWPKIMKIPFLYVPEDQSHNSCKLVWEP